MIRLPLTALLLASSLAGANPLPDQAAQITYETRTTTPDGIVKESRWQERWLRVGDTLWSERLIPLPLARAFHARHDRQSGHKHFTHQMAARWVEPDAQGKPYLRYADRWHKQVVEVPAPEYGMVDFQPDWANLRQLFDPAHLTRMQPLNTPAPEGARWYQEEQGNERTRVLWSQARQLALVVESGSLDGWRHYRMTVTPKALPTALPWQSLDGFQELDIRDFFD
ncbi:hypothetical protein [Aeromonas simiae]|uniref:DUF3108 domain-containing protein n=1 Tax=Aeromonas simiae TaxID=218936 RepID=A0A5J6WYV9_9GAMM|nr:hypothetical protein [Aeromonas simiae]MDO2953719.1 hypothetical protein [Aeromonas simiae]QFI54913.1 hypothetical protein FE240_09605 [Aeromonas simiae]